MKKISLLLYFLCSSILAFSQGTLFVKSPWSVGFQTGGGYLSDSKIDAYDNKIITSEASFKNTLRLWYKKKLELSFNWVKTYRYETNYPNSNYNALGASIAYNPFFTKAPVLTWLRLGAYKGEYCDCTGATVTKSYPWETYFHYGLALEFMLTKQLNLTLSHDRYTIIVNRGGKHDYLTALISLGYNFGFRVKKTE